MLNECDKRDASTDEIKRLIGEGANIDHANIYGKTPLYFATANGNLNVVRCLVKACADVHTADNDGDTQLIKSSNATVLKF